MLTILDFVGHHRNAIVSLQALSSAALELLPGRIVNHSLALSPPRDCAIILEDQTEQILLKVQRELPNLTSRAAHTEAYLRLREELGHAPDLMAFWGRPDVPEFRELRCTFGSWIDLREQPGDADEWERSVRSDPLAWALLKAAETDLQLQRVGGYAAFWALAFFPDDVEQGVLAFFDRFPHWRVEAPVNLPKALATLEKKARSRDPSGRAPRPGPVHPVAS